MFLIGSRAAIIHFPDHRAPNDWDLVVDGNEYERLTGLFGPPVRSPRTPALSRPTQSPTTIHRHRGETYELKPEATDPLWSWVLSEPVRVEEGESTFIDSVLGEVRCASPSLLLLLKQSSCVHPLLFWRKTLLDYHFLKARVPVVPVRMVEGARLACQRMESRFVRFSRVSPWRPLVCAPVPGVLDHKLEHEAAHERYARSPAGPLAAQDDAWRGFPSREPRLRRELMIELLVEEALVLAHCRQLAAERALPKLSLFNWVLRVLITQELPIRWSYFAVDEYRAIQGRLMGARFPSDASV